MEAKEGDRNRNCIKSVFIVDFVSENRKTENRLMHSGEHSWLFMPAWVCIHAAHAYVATWAPIIYIFHVIISLMKPFQI